MFHTVYFWLPALIGGLFILVKAAGAFNRAAEKIGISFGMPPFITGVLITAIGTSLPELITSIIAVTSDASEIVPGNVTGSNITNIFLIIGIVAIVHRKPIRIVAEFITVDLQFLIGSALFITMVFYDGKVGLFEGVLCMAGFLVYLLYQVKSTRKRHPRSWNIPKNKDRARLQHYLMFLVSGLIIYVSGDLVIRAVVFLSSHYEIGTAIVAAGVIAFGTSLPELVVSLNAIRNNKSDYALGNILGSSIFNAFLVVGLSSMFGLIRVPPDVIHFTAPVMLIATFLFYMLTRDKIISIWEGALFLLFYLLFLSGLIEMT